MDMMWYRRRGLMVTPHIERVTGAIASFNSDYNKIPVKSLICDIEPIQEGTGDPSPENVRPISGLAGLSVVRTGVNVWDEETEYGYYSAVNGQIGSNISTQLRSKNYISVKPSTSYVFKKSHNLGDILFYDANKSYISALINLGSNRVFMTPENCYYIRLNFGSTYGNTYNHDIGLNYPATNTEYHAYKGNTYSVNWETEAGTVYGGTLDVVSGKLTMDSVLLSFDGTEAWDLISSAAYLALWGNPSSISNNDLTQISNYLTGGGGNYTIFGKYRAQTNGAIVIGNITNNQAPYTYKWETATDFKAYLAEHPLQVCYKIATPTEIQLTPQEVRTLLGENNIWCDSGDVSVDYWKWGK